MFQVKEKEKYFLIIAFVTTYQVHNTNENSVKALCECRWRNIV